MEKEERDTITDLDDDSLNLGISKNSRFDKTKELKPELNNYHFQKT